MITGDNPETARAIAQELGIGAACASPASDSSDISARSDQTCHETITGRDLARMSDEELERRIGSIAVFARVDPEHKLRIVQALKNQGHVVAMTGDGVNDAPALKRADIGVSMGITGTDVARESSEMVLADDNFATIIAAVEEGRTIFANLRKVVHYLLATNTGEVLVFIVAILAGLPLPLLPVQILWVNLVTDGFSTAPLSVEPREGEVLAQPPRDPREPVVTKRSIRRIVMVALTMTAGTLGVFYYSMHASGLVFARTMAFATLAIFQLFNAFNARSATQSIFRLGFMSNPYVMIGIGVSLMLQVMVIHVPILQRIFETTSLSLRDWTLVIGVSSSIWIVEEIRKALAPHLFEAGSSIRTGADRPARTR
jgi:Ca2+-transporting ATPase